MRHLLVVLSVCLLVTDLAQAQTPIQIQETTTRHGPETGSLLIIGGGGATPEIWSRFTELAGGKEKARIVVITAAAGDSAALNPTPLELIKRETGIQRVTLLHTNSLEEANSERFVAPLREATGVYFVGGRQWRIADRYLNTLTHRALQQVLERGGVIAGTSAGATIQGSFLWRGDTRGAHILIGDHTQGLAFLKNSAIDQHLLRRNRQFDLVHFIANAPELIGIGLDEATAIVVQRDLLEVVGRSYVAIYDHDTLVGKRTENHVEDEKEIYTVSNGPFILLSQGQKYDLAKRSVVAAPARASSTTNQK
ncbi:cyanophycinase [Rhabdobacter roseus]|uniref:Cyanophycinase n=1 Tax=Rhabdobacter roseus TaxID=1655419 RepID=A0A840TNP0_9BACT|nr:cyanophycinase [Rhabdobacter roseus]MBB5285896.1 cyanophycinase [Rhabdobacter roseus]